MEGVMTIVSHLVITLAVLGSYLFTVWKGVPDETLKNLLMVIGGYWFGVIGGNKVKEMFSKKPEDGSSGQNPNI